MWPNFHEDDILSAALYPTGLVATSAYDGVVKVWNIETGHVNCKLNGYDYGLETVESVIPGEVKKRISRGNVICYSLPRQVIQPVNRFQQGLDHRKSIDAGVSTKYRRIMQSSWKLKNTSLLHKDSSASEVSQKKKSVLQFDKPLEGVFQDSYHNSSVDKVQFFFQS